MRDCSSPAALIVLAFALALHGTAAAQPPTAVSPQPAPHQAEEWRLAGSNREAYVIDATGSVTGAEGATVAVRCVNPESAGFGTASARVPADAYRQRRVTLAAEVQTAGAKGGATIWLRIDAGTQVLLLENGMDQPLRGDTA